MQQSVQYETAGDVCSQGESTRAQRKSRMCVDTFHNMIKTDSAPERRSSILSGDVMEIACTDHFMAM